MLFNKTICIVCKKCSLLRICFFHKLVHSWKNVLLILDLILCSCCFFYCNVPFYSFYSGMAERNANFEALPEDWRARLKRRKATSNTWAFLNHTCTVRTFYCWICCNFEDTYFSSITWERILLDLGIFWRYTLANRPVKWWLGLILLC